MGTKKPRIVFVANEDYLTLPWLEEIPRLLKMCDCFLIDPDRLDVENPIDTDMEFLQRFEVCAFNRSFSNEEFKEKERWILKVIDQIKPDLIFGFTTLNFSYRCIRKHYPNVKIYIQQVGYFKSRTRRVSRRISIKNTIYNFLKQSPVRPLNKDYWSFNLHTIHGVWSEEFIPESIRSKVNYRVSGNQNLIKSFEHFADCKEIVHEGSLRKFIYLTQPLNDFFDAQVIEDSLILINEILESDQSIRLSIKLHPRDHLSNYEYLFEKGGSRVIEVKDKFIETALLEQDIALVHYSSAIDIAVAMNIPILIIDPHKVFIQKLPFTSEFVTTISSFSDYEVFKSKSHVGDQRLIARNNHLNRASGFQKGNTFERVCDIVDDILK